LEDLVFTNRYLLTGKVLGKANDKHIGELQKRIIKTFLRLAKRHKTIIKDVNCGGVLREGFYWNGYEQPIHIHACFSSLYELKLTKHKERSTGKSYYSTKETQKFSNKLIQLRIDEVYDAAGINEYVISPSKNPDIWVPRQSKFY
tara:strand:+ start:81 stop:515 length:435 start_codon:yes stop_codon:yes gene_type:complete